MACLVCGRERAWHGSETGLPGTYLNETGCHDGVRMDDDVHGEGWQPDVIYPPCEFNPRCCPTCSGTGNAPPLMAEALQQDDCADCHGTGWKDGKCEWPVSIADEAAE